jgi:hypothetical protein
VGLTIMFICGLYALGLGMVVTGVKSYEWRGVLHTAEEML